MGLDSQTFRQALGQFATGICVVTAQDNDGHWVGMTINSFASVSLDPALVLWSIQNNSQCYEIFTQAKQFNLSVLSDQQMAISNHYATPDNHHVPEEHSKDNNGLIDGALATFCCESWANYDGGDHRILVGKVEDTAIIEGKPLLFASGQYRELAEPQ